VHILTSTATVRRIVNMSALAVAGVKHTRENVYEQAGSRLAQQ
jgi:hypothetical protein